MTGEDVPKNEKYAGSPAREIIARGPEGGWRMTGGG